MSTSALLAQLDDVGRDPRRGGYSRHVFDPAERDLRDWFGEQARARGLDVHADRNANLWAWWGGPGPDAVVTGSHLDSVPGGGAFDGPLGVAAALGAVDELRATGFQPGRPLAIVVFAEEEGGRFGVPCLGSRLLSGSIDRDTACALRDQGGTTFAEALRAAGGDPARAGADPELLGGIGKFVELHVEQGRGLVDLGRPVAVATSILGHGRWRFRFRGQGNHAGATPLEDRSDPMLPAARTVLAAREAAARHEARATVGRLVPNPGGTNVIASSTDLWLDARAPLDTTTRAVVAELTARAEEHARAEGCRVDVTEESYSPTAHFDQGLRAELTALLDDAPALATGAGHDAGVLSTRVPTSMLFVRNPTGISHAPDEHAEPADCEAGTAALARVLRRWAA
ncbi:allantoate amidohydrolase [Saccharopolyspora sp. MS10]|uniref:allantoate amidohydrolase n=1 Tax=Saccharopolyspora sp. MS10 TaxID=3385973 RepID=UPI0039A04CD8